MSPRPPTRAPQLTTVSQTPRINVTAPRPATGAGAGSSNILKSPFVRVKSPSKFKLGNSTSSASSQATTASVTAPKIRTNGSARQIIPSNNATPGQAVSNTDPRQPSSPMSVTDYELTAEELSNLVAVPEPQRCYDWMKTMFVAKENAEVQQTVVWNLYNQCFLQHKSRYKLLSATEVLNNFFRVFPEALLKSSADRFVVQGIARRTELESPPVLNRPVSQPFPIPFPAVQRNHERMAVVNGLRASRLNNVGGDVPASPSELTFFSSNYNGPNLQAVQQGTPPPNNNVLYASTSSNGSNSGFSLNGSRTTIGRRSSTPITAINPGRTVYSSTPLSAPILNSSVPTAATGASGSIGMDDVANRVLELVRPVIEQISEKMRKSVLERLDEGFGTLGKDKGKGKDRAMDIDEEKHEAEDMDIIDSSAEKEQNGKKIIEVLGILVDRVKDMGRDVKNIGNDLHTMKIVLGIPRALGVDNGGGGNGPFALAGRKRRRNGPDDEIEEITELGSARQVPFEVKPGKSVLERLESIEMDVQEWLERARDPMAGIEVYEQDVPRYNAGDPDTERQEDAPPSEPDPDSVDAQLQPQHNHSTPPISGLPLQISVTSRHEIGTSPIRLTSTPPPALQKVDVAIGTALPHPSHFEDVTAHIPASLPSFLKDAKMAGRKSLLKLIQGQVQGHVQGQGIILPMIRGYEGSVIDVDADDGEMRSTAGAVVRAGEVEDRYVVMREVEAGLQLEPESEQEASGVESLSSLSSLTSSGGEDDSESEQDNEQASGTKEGPDPAQGEEEVGHRDQEEMQTQPESEERQPQPTIDSDDEPGVKEDIFGPYRPNMANFLSSTPASGSASRSVQKMKMKAPVDSPTPGRAFSPGQRRSADPGPSKQRKSVRVDEDEDMHMADVEDAAEPCSSLNAVKPSEGRKGKEKATQAAGDAETESAWPVASRRPAILTNSTPRSKARLPSGTRGRGGSSSNTNGRNSSGSGRGSASEASPTSKCISNTSSSGSFSPVDWTKMKDGQEVQALKLSPNATLILKPGDPNGNSGIANSTNPNQTSPGISIGSIKDPHAPAMSPSASRQSVIPPQAMVPSRSYTLPPPPEGSIAALRQETQGLAYPNSYVYGSKEDGGEEERVEMVIGADAGERMLSPESQDSGDEEEGDEGKREDQQAGLEKEDNNEVEDLHVDMRVEGLTQEKEERGIHDRTAVASASKSESALTAHASVSSVVESTTSVLSSLPAQMSPARSPPPSPQSSAMQDTRFSSHASSPPSASPVPPAVVDDNLSETIPRQTLPEKDLLDSNSQSTSGTADDEARVQSLVLDAVSPMTSPVKPPLQVTADVTMVDADMSVDTIRGPDDDQSRSPTQGVLTPKASTSTLSSDETISRPTVPAFSLPSIEVEADLHLNGDMEVDDVQADAQINGVVPEVDEAALGSDRSGESSPLFTSPAKPPYDDVSCHEEGFDLTSSPPKPAAEATQGKESGTEQVMTVEEESTTPRAVPNTIKSNDKARASSSPRPEKVSSVHAVPDSLQESPEIILISSDEEAEVRPRPKPRHKAKKLHIFDGPADEVKSERASHH
ncbi:hypothetical protein CPB84DRAFT_217175 [Gymnopilus junonius]|uniref:RFX-type winged-helix domain-containing protein n=1 Tax=Gymnopilus junonius TaxID=109634 RepID=A0A9P5NFW8_GYMJU|nr:hypothetical protein CPB84DRAFT_217175 [Gymnopilus junonius]